MDIELQPILSDWLEGAYLLASSDDAQQAIAQLNLGEILVNQRGDVFSRHSVSYHGENSNLHGVLERQQQLENLQSSQPILLQNLQNVNVELVKVEAQLQTVRQQQQQENQQLKQATHQEHQAQLELARLQQVQIAATERNKSIQLDIASTKTRLEELSTDKTKKQVAQQDVSNQLGALEAKKQQDLSTKQHAAEAYEALRTQIQHAEKNHQDIFYQKKLIINIMNDLNNKLNVNSDEKSAFLMRQKETETALALTPMDTLKANLSVAIDQKQQREVALAEARNHLSGQDMILQDLERLRMQNEQQLHPLRDSLEQSRLNEQEARLHFEQCLAGLQENGLGRTRVGEKFSRAMHGPVTWHVKRTNLSNKFST